MRPASKRFRSRRSAKRAAQHQFCPGSRVRQPLRFPAASRQVRGGECSVSPHDIVGIWIGTNDILAAALPTTPSIFQPIGSRPDVATFTNNVISNVRSGIDGLVASGVRNIILATPYDLSVSAIFRSIRQRWYHNTRVCESVFRQPAQSARNTLYTGVNTYFFDTLTLMDRVQANPAAYGFIHATSLDNCSSSAACNTGPACRAEYLRVQRHDPYHHCLRRADVRYIRNIINARTLCLRRATSHRGPVSLFEFADRCLDAQRRTAANPSTRSDYRSLQGAARSSGAPEDKFSVFVDGFAAVRRWASRRSISEFEKARPAPCGDVARRRQSVPSIDDVAVFWTSARRRQWWYDRVVEHVGILHAAGPVLQAAELEQLSSESRG